MIVNVTAEDLADGDRGNCFTCPVALSLTRVLGPGVTVHVTSYRIAWCHTFDLAYNVSAPMAKRTRTPQVVAMLISRHDRGAAVEPFSFELPDDFFSKE